MPTPSALRRVAFAGTLLAFVPLACSPGTDQQSGELRDAPDQIYTVDGWMSLESDYIPRVCTQENGNADYQALVAQAIAARTYLLRAMRDDSALGTTAKPVGNGEFFQAYSATANPGCVAATNESRGVVMTWSGELIVANYVAGALVRSDGSLGKDPTHTQHFVTINDGKSGADVTPAPRPIALPSRSDNRGCMGQNRAHHLSLNGYFAHEILEYFYGNDIEFVGLSGVEPPREPGRVCDDIPPEGACTGTLLQWCGEGEVHSFDCARTGRTCVAEAGEPGHCEETADPPTSCGNVDYEGVCEGDEVVYCNDDGLLERVDCAAQNLTCGDPGVAGKECVPPIDGQCGVDDIEPQCVGTVFVRCSGDQLRSIDCASIGQACGYVKDEDGSERVDCLQVIQ